jgi:hypothetical protein
MSRTIQRMDVGKHNRIWEDERGGFVSWSNGSKTFEEAQLLGMRSFFVTRRSRRTRVHRGQAQR